MYDRFARVVTASFARNLGEFQCIAVLGVEILQRITVGFKVPAGDEHLAKTFGGTK